MIGFAFPRRLRLLNAGEYSGVFQHVQVRVSDKHLLILATPSSTPNPRLGLVIAKKHVRLASDRNRVKRIIRESFRVHREHLPNMDLVVLARPGLGQLENRELHLLMAKSWKRLAKYAQKVASGESRPQNAGQRRP